MEKEKCRKCGSQNTELKKSGVQTGLYCKDCAAWIRWLKKTEVNDWLSSETSKPEAEQKTEAEPQQDPCWYCLQDYVIPHAYDGGITSWTHVDSIFCPRCGRKLKEENK